MAIPPDLLAQFAQDPSLTPQAAAVAHAAGTVEQAPEPDAQYEDVLLNGWGYRSYGDGKIKIIVAPEGHKAGQILTGGPAYDAIAAEIASTKPPPLPAPPPAPAGDPTRTALDAWRSGSGGAAPFPALE